MGQHRSRWYLAPTLALTAVTLSGVAGVAVGPLFTSPVVEFEASAGLFPVAGGQAGRIERGVSATAALPPTVRPRPVKAPRPATDRGLTTSSAKSVQRPARTFPPPVPESSWAEVVETAPEATPSASAPSQADPTCRWSK